jgi:hypothetical protein
MVAALRFFLRLGGPVLFGGDPFNIYIIELDN